MQNNYNFSEFDEVILSYFYFSEELVLPLKIDIANVRIKESNVKHFKAKKENNTLTVNLTDSPYKKDYEYAKFKNEILEYLDYIDCESKLFDNGDSNLLQHLKLNNRSELLDFLIKDLEVPMTLFVDLKLEIEYYKGILMSNFM